MRPRSENGLESSRRPGTAKRFEPWPHGCPVRNVRFTGQSFNGRPIRTWTARLASNPEWESEVGVGPLGDVFPVRQVVPVLPARFDDVSMAAVVGERPPEADRKPASVRGSDGPGDRRYRVLEAPWRSGEILPVVADSRPKNIVHATESTRDVGTLCGRTSPAFDAALRSGPRSRAVHHPGPSWPTPLLREPRGPSSLRSLLLHGGGHGPGIAVPVRAGLLRLLVESPAKSLGSDARRSAIRHGGPLVEAEPTDVGGFSTRASEDSEPWGVRGRPDGGSEVVLLPADPGTTARACYPIPFDSVGGWPYRCDGVPTSALPAQDHRRVTTVRSWVTLPPSCRRGWREWKGTNR